MHNLYHSEVVSEKVSYSLEVPVSSQINSRKRLGFHIDIYFIQTTGFGEVNPTPCSCLCAVLELHNPEPLFHCSSPITLGTRLNSTGFCIVLSLEFGERQVTSGYKPPNV